MIHHNLVTTDPSPWLTQYINFTQVHLHPSFLSTEKNIGFYMIVKDFEQKEEPIDISKFLLRHQKTQDLQTKIYTFFT